MDTLVNPALGKMRHEGFLAFKEILNYKMTIRQASKHSKPRNILSQRQQPEQIVKYYSIYMIFLKKNLQRKAYQKFIGLGHK